MLFQPVIISIITATITISNANAQTLATTTTSRPPPNHDMCRQYLNKSRLWDRLPPLAKPEFYDLTFYLDPEDTNERFAGRAVIDINVTETTDAIMINGHVHQYERVVYQPESGSELQAQTYACPANMSVVLRFQQQLNPGPGRLTIDFRAVYNPERQGLYKTVHRMSDGSYSRMLATQMEPIHAREAFPCFDQPDLKAKFQITLNIPDGYSAISNTEVVNTTMMNNTNSRFVRQVMFDVTPQMPTYLVAMSVGAYDWLELQSIDGITPQLIRVYVPAGRRQYGETAVRWTRQTWKAFHDYFQDLNIEYPINKYDVVTVPDFRAHAMENYGCIIQRQDWTEHEPESWSYRLIEIEKVIVHEMAHQWFGNLVTCRWWGDLWINEGFAEFFDHKISHPMMLEQGYDVWLEFRAGDMQDNMNIDTSLAQMAHSVEHPASIYRPQGAFVYRKGSTLVRMIEHWIGEEAFQRSIIQFLQEYQYSNARNEDMLGKFESVGGLPGNFTKWLYQYGLPTVKVKKTLNGRDLQLRLTQWHWSPINAPNDDFLWPIPITVRILSNHETPIIKSMMTERNHQIVIPGVGPGAVVKLNADSIGYYRTMYDQATFESFIPFIKNRMMSATDKVNIISDLLAMVKAGDRNQQVIPMRWALEYLTNFAGDDSYGVWKMFYEFFLVYFGQANNGTVDENHGRLKEFAKKITTPLYERFGWTASEDEDRMTRMVRPMVIEIMCWVVNDQRVRQEGKRLFDEELVDDDTRTIDNDVRTVVYEIAGFNFTDNKTLHEYWYPRYYRTESLSMRHHIRRFLSAMDSKDLEASNEQFMAKAIRDGVLKLHEVIDITSGFPWNPKKFGHFWTFMRNNVGQKAQVPQLRHVPRMIVQEWVESTFKHHSNDQTMEEVRAFLRDNGYPMEILDEATPTFRSNQRMVRAMRSM